MSRTYDIEIRYTAPESTTSNLVRFLELHPGNGAEMIQCSLYEAAMLDYRGGYEALSYTWGNTLCPRPIIVNNAAVQVTTNLESALRHIRLASDSRTLWIDAICINQKNSAEKVHQIKQMGEIYKGARHVIVWLGPSDESSDMAMNFAQTLYDIWSVDPSIKQNSNEAAITAFDWAPHAEKFCCPLYATEILAVKKLLMRSWWSRAWIVQEFLLNKNVIFYSGTIMKPLGPIRGLLSFWGFCFGNKKFEDFGQRNLEVGFGPYFQATSDLMHRRSEVYRTDDGMTGVLDTFASRSELSYHLLRSLSVNRGRGCTLYHDRVFSILGVVYPQFKDSLAINYSQSQQQLYTQVFRSYVNVIGGLDIICHRQPVGPPSTLPTWLPDWSVHRAGRIYGDESRFHKTPINASGCSRAVVKILENGTLEALGFQIGTLNKTALETRQPLGVSVDAVGFWQFSPTSHQYMAPLKSLLADGKTSKLFLAGERVFTTLLAQMQSPASNDPGAGWTTEAWRKWNYIFATTTRNRTIFTTHEGHIGLAFQAAKEGDKLCLLFGCNAPVVLRKRDDSKWTFLGDTFVHGIMDGEAMREYNQDCENVINFILI